MQRPNKIKRSITADVDRVIIPVHQSVHWVTAVVDIKGKELRYYDSMGGKDATCLENLARWIRDEFKDKKKEDIDTSDWPRIFLGKNGECKGEAKGGEGVQL